jgi:[citrate (pro-3S)-lyase] ligase
MYGYSISAISLSDRRSAAQVDRLLSQEGIKRDANLDYTVGVYDESGNLAATGSCYGSTIRCVAVDSARQGEGLLGTVVSRLLERLAVRGVTHVFLYTKRETARYFRDIGFYEIAHAEGLAVFMENRRDGFPGFVRELSRHKREGLCSALVMNCNPFTLGHLRLAETASRESGFVHIFAVSEDASFFPFADRYELIRQGVSGLKNVMLHETRNYMISSAVFPSYFLEDEESAIIAQARLDLSIFKKIAASLGVTRRYVGTEPFSRVTAAYNSVMKEELPKAGIGCVEVPRAELDGSPISASRVRQAIRDGDMDAARRMLPRNTYEYILSERGQEAVRKIREAASVAHY